MNEFRAALPAWAVPAVAAALYGGVMVHLTRAVVGEETPAVALLVLAGVVQVAGGFAVGRWWALLLGAVPVLAAVPFGGPEECSEFCIPYWVFVAAVMVVGGVPLLAAGVTASQLRRPREPRPGRRAHAAALLGVLASVIAVVLALSSTWFLLIAPAAGAVGAGLGTLARRRGAAFDAQLGRVAILLGFLPLVVLVARWIESS